jgi:hypothetical protein
MTTNPTTPTMGVPFVHAAHLLAAHLADHELPEPASLLVMTRHGRSEVTAQVRCDTVPRVAADLLAWADTLSADTLSTVTVTVGAWRTPAGDRVHLSIASTLTGPAGAVALDVYGGVDDDPVLFADLAVGEHRAVSLGQLRTWAASASDTTGGGAVA